MVGSVSASGGSNSSNDELHDNHASSSKNKERASANLLDHDERGRGGQHVDKSCDERDEERVADGAELLEEDRAEVKDEVDTSQLLHGLHEDANRSAASVGRGLRELSLETSHP